MAIKLSVRADNLARRHVPFFIGDKTGTSALKEYLNSTPLTRIKNLKGVGPTVIKEWFDYAEQSLHSYKKKTTLERVEEKMKLNVYGMGMTNRSFFMALCEVIDEMEAKR